MATFEPARKIVHGNEGGYHPGGGVNGETYQGLDRNHVKDAAIWARVDSWTKKLGKKIGQFFPDPELDDMIKNYYYKNFWLKSGSDKIQNQDLANLFYDFYMHKPAVAVAAAVNAATNAAVVNGTVYSSSNGMSLSGNTLLVMNRDTERVYKRIYDLRILHYENKWMNKNSKGGWVFYYNPTRPNGSQYGLLLRAKRRPAELPGAEKKNFIDVFNPDSWSRFSNSYPFKFR